MDFGNTDTLFLYKIKVRPERLGYHPATHLVQFPGAFHLRIDLGIHERAGGRRIELDCSIDDIHGNG